MLPRMSLILEQRGTLQHVFLYVGIPTSGPYISDWVENAYKKPYISFCDYLLLWQNLALFVM